MCQEWVSGRPLLDVLGTLQLLDTGHVRPDKALLRSLLVGGVWNGFLPDSG